MCCTVLSVTTSTPSRRAAWDALAVFLLIAAGILVSVFFVSWWGRNAQGAGRNDMGMALALSFAVPLSLYGSLGVAAVSLLAAFGAAWRRRGTRLYVAALMVASMPCVFLLLLDAGLR